MWYRIDPPGSRFGYRGVGSVFAGFDSGVAAGGTEPGASAIKRVDREVLFVGRGFLDRLGERRVGVYRFREFTR